MATALPLYQERFENGANGVVYHGIAKPGVAETDANWQIREYIYVTGEVTEIKFAGGSRKLTKKWSLRATYTYS